MNKLDCVGVVPVSEGERIDVATEKKEWGKCGLLNKLCIILSPFLVRFLGVSLQGNLRINGIT